MQLCRFRAAYTVLLPHPKLYITDWYGVSNLPIPQSDPRGHSLNKLESLDRPTSLQQPKKPVSTSHRGVFSQHPHRAPRGSITFSPPLLFILHVYRVTKTVHCMILDIIITIRYHMWFCIVMILLCKHWGSHSALNHLIIIGSVFFEGLKMTR